MAKTSDIIYNITLIPTGTNKYIQTHTHITPSSYLPNLLRLLLNLRTQIIQHRGRLLRQLRYRHLQLRIPRIPLTLQHKLIAILPNLMNFLQENLDLLEEPAEVVVILHLEDLLELADSEDLVGALCYSLAEGLEDLDELL